jgi:hypothetical protein
MRAKEASLPAWSFENLIGSETGNDVELELDDASVMFAHKVFLSRSAVFSPELLRSNPIVFKDVPAEAARALVRYLYTDSISRKQANNVNMRLQSTKSMD